MTAAAAASEALRDMEGQKMGNRSKLGESNGPWITYSLTKSLNHSLFVGPGAEHCPYMFQTLHTTVQGGPSLEFITATTSRECNIQDARGRVLCLGRRVTVDPLACGSPGLHRSHML